MSTLATELEIPSIQDVSISSDTLQLDLSDVRSISIPLAWFPRLLHANQGERSNWRLIGRGEGIHWEELDEDISIEGILAGRPSRESQTSLKKWLQKRNSQQ